MGLRKEGDSGAGRMGWEGWGNGDGHKFDLAAL